MLFMHVCTHGPAALSDLPAMLCRWHSMQGLQCLLPLPARLFVVYKTHESAQLKLSCELGSRSMSPQAAPSPALPADQLQPPAASAIHDGMSTYYASYTPAVAASAVSSPT